jgi:hypothetical protein
MSANVFAEILDGNRFSELRASTAGPPLALSSAFGNDRYPLTSRSRSCESRAIERPASMLSFPAAILIG